MTRFIVLVLALFLTTSETYAEWVEVGSTENFTEYADPETIRRKVNLAKIWTLSDFKTLQQTAGVSYLSMKQQWEFDCEEERHRMLMMAEFSGNMGKGAVVYSSPTEVKWTPVAPGSIGEGLWEFACGKK